MIGSDSDRIKQQIQRHKDFPNDFMSRATDHTRLMHFKIRAGTREDLPRPSITPAEVVERLMSHIGARA